MANASVVCFVLADKYRDPRGYVDESVDQIAEAVAMKPGTVRNVLAALDQLGLWVKIGKGNQHSGTRRRPTFVPEHGAPTSRSSDGKHRASSHTEQNGSAEGEHREVAHEHREVSAGASCAQTHDSPVPPCVSPTNESLYVFNNAVEGLDRDDLQLAADHIRRHIEFHAHKIDDPEAVRITQTREAERIIGICRADGTDPTGDLEANWPTEHPPDTTEGDYEMGQYAGLSVLERVRIGVA